MDRNKPLEKISFNMTLGKLLFAALPAHFARSVAAVLDAFHALCLEGVAAQLLARRLSRGQLQRTALPAVPQGVWLHA